MRFVVGGTEIDATVDGLIVAGWTGRDAGAVAHHIEELSALGVTAPGRVPLFYRVSASLLVQSSKIEVLGDASLLQSGNHGGCAPLGQFEVVRIIAAAIGVPDDVDCGQLGVIL